MVRFDWADPFCDDQLEDDKRMIRDSARAYAEDKLAPRIIDAFAHETTDPEIFREMGALGLLGPIIPEEYGGVGAKYVAYGLVARNAALRVLSGAYEQAACAAASAKGVSAQWPSWTTAVSAFSCRITTR